MGIEGSRSMSQLRVVHYLNQFFAGIGGEEKADTAPGSEGRPLGPGNALNQALTSSEEGRGGGDGVLRRHVFHGERGGGAGADCGAGEGVGGGGAGGGAGVWVGSVWTGVRPGVPQGRGCAGDPGCCGDAPWEPGGGAVQGTGVHGFNLGYGGGDGGGDRGDGETGGEAGSRGGAGACGRGRVHSDGSGEDAGTREDDGAAACRHGAEEGERGAFRDGVAPAFDGEDRTCAGDRVGGRGKDSAGDGGGSRASGEPGQDPERVGEALGALRYWRGVGLLPRRMAVGTRGIRYDEGQSGPGPGGCRWM